MPIFRIVYVEDDTFAPRTLTAAFPDCAAAEIEMARHGHRVAHIAEMRSGESAGDPITVPMVPDDKSGEIPIAPPVPGRRVPATGARPLLGIPAYDIAGVAVIAAGIVMAGAAFLLF